MEIIRWRLIYADGAVLDEPESGGTILESFPNPSELHLLVRGKAVCRIPLEPNEKPIFYRQRSVTAKTGTGGVLFGNGLPFVASTPRLDAVVFGAAKETDDRVFTRLWAYIDGRVIDCPKRHIAEGAIRLQVGG